MFRNELIQKLWLLYFLALAFAAGFIIRAAMQSLADDDRTRDLTLIRFLLGSMRHDLDVLISSRHMESKIDE